MHTKQVEILEGLLPAARLVDVKTFESEVSLRAFVANFLSYYPWWLRALYTIRSGFAALLRLEHRGIPPGRRLHAEDIAMQAGAAATFFRVVAAQEDAYWVAGAKDNHLNAYLAVLQDETATGQRCFHVATLLAYNSWKGPLYFNIIRPFHHLVVAQMGKAGAA